MFWAETLAIGGSALALRRQSVAGSPYHLFLVSLAMIGGGMVYRYAPPALAFAPVPMAWYTPSVIEILISLGFIAICHLAFLWAVKRLPILPAPVSDWYDVVDYYRHLYPWVAKWREEHAASQHRPGYSH